jgi:type II secretory pathway component GspD/PulD (secretin)
MKRLAALALLGGILTLNAGTAQPPKPTQADPTVPKTQRTHYTVRNADPAILAEVVGQHFKGDATVLAGSGNAVLISGTPVAVPEVVKLLEQLDRKPWTVEVEIVIAEVTLAKDGKELTPSALAELSGKGSQRIKLTAVEGQPVTTTIGGSKPYVSGAMFGGGKGGAGGGGIQRSVTYQSVGTTVKMTARLGSEDTIRLDLSVQDSKIGAAEEEGGSPSFDNNNLSTKLSVMAGKPVVAQTVRTEGKSGATISVVVVTARIADAGSPRP